jgi:hypothetical protein
MVRRVVPLQTVAAMELAADREAFAVDCRRWRGGRLFGVGFRAAGEGGDDSGGDDHCYESKADKKIMHWSGSLVGFV